MSAETLLRLVSHSIFAFVFAVGAYRALRNPNRANINVVLLFGLVTAFVVHYWLVALSVFPSDNVAQRVIPVLVLAMPLVLLRLANDFARVSKLAFILGGAGLATSGLALLLWTPPPRPVQLGVVAYFIAGSVYAVVVFWRMRKHAVGVTRRRLSAITRGTFILAVAVLVAGINSQLADPEAGVIVIQVLALLTAICYVLGFAPPAFVRRAWQQPELLNFLGRSASILSSKDQVSVLRELGRGIGGALGGGSGNVGLADLQKGTLSFLKREQDELHEVDIDKVPSGEVLKTQRARVWERVEDVNPAMAEEYRRHGVRTMLCAPLTVEDRRLGVILVYGASPSIFSEEDLTLLQLLAGHAAILLEARLLLLSQAETLARQAVNQSKEDFLSAAAHDLRTPLSTIVTQAQILDMRAARDPGQPMDATGIKRILKEAFRLRDLVSELLDAASADNGRLIGARTSANLAEVVLATEERLPELWRRCVVKTAPHVRSHADVTRIGQLIDNLVQNAAKYSPGDAPIEIEVWEEDSEARLRVRDHGIGIPEADLPRLFNRFYRASNVSDRSFPGMGLGLFICRAIAEQHGGRIWVGSSSAQGTSFEVALPLEAPKALAAAAVGAAA